MSVETIAEIDNVYEQGAGYKLVGTDTSTLYVPNAPGNRHYELILAWIDEGNTVEEAVYADLHPRKNELLRSRVKHGICCTRPIGTTSASKLEVQQYP